MKNDDHDFGGNLHGNGGDAEGDSPIARELEARIVAAVAGEASAFETAELERIAAENPAVAEFKQRIEAVHSVVTEATQPDAQPLRLSAERRAKVLAAIGAVPAAAAADKKVVPLVDKRKKAWHRQRWLIGMAACATLLVLLLIEGGQRFFGEKKERITLDLFQSNGPPGPSSPRVSDRSVLVWTDGSSKAPAAKAAAEYPAQMLALPVLTDATTVAPTPPPSQNFDNSPFFFQNRSSVGGSINTPSGKPALRMNAGVDDSTPVGFGSTIAVQPPAKTLGFGGSVTLGATGAAVSEEAAKAKIAGYDVFDSNAPAAAPVPATPVSSPASDIVKMDAFVVSAPLESGSYAAMSLSTNRASMNVTPPSLTDVAQTNAEIMARDLNRAGGENQAKTETHAGLVPLVPSSGAIVIDDPVADVQTATGARSNVDTPLNLRTVTLGTLPVSGDFIDTGSGGARTSPPADSEARMDLSKELADLRRLNERPTGEQRATETVVLNEEIAMNRREQDRLAQERGPQQELAKKRAEEAKVKAAMDEERPITGGAALSVFSDKDASYAKGAAVAASAGKKQSTLLGNLNIGSLGSVALTGGAFVGDEKDKADAPIARPKIAVDESLRVETATAAQAVSTFSLHVSDVSFRLAQAALGRGEAPDPATIRPEEFYNAFDYGDPTPAEAEKVGCVIEQAAHPFIAQRNLARIAMKVAATGRLANKPLRLTVLLDTSGSMEREDRAATVRKAMEVLVSLLGPNDRLTLIGFARQPRLLAEGLAGDRAHEVLDIIARTPAEGGTNMEEALKLATELAVRQRDANGQNRIVMLTDGAANLGNAIPEQLATRIEQLRQRGIAFDACGVGLDGLDDGILEALTRKGDGRYYVLNSPEDADAGFARKLAGAFRPAAENVKVQVRFNPARVATHRLIGFEQHRLQEQDFRNDKVDAAELAAEEAGVALYQFEPLPQGEGDVGEVFVRFRDPATGAMVERSWTIPYEPRVAAFDRAAPSLQLAGAAAMLAEKLRADALAGQIALRDFAKVMSALQVRYRNESRVQDLATMFLQARRLTGE